MTLLLEQFVVPLKQPLPYRFSLENTLAEYLFPAARFAIGWFDPLLRYDASPLQSMSLQCLDGDRGYYSDEPIRERLHLTTGADFLAANDLFHFCQTVIQEHTVRLKVVEDGTVLFQATEHPTFIGASCGKISSLLAQSLTQPTPTAFQVGFGIKPQGNHTEYRFAIATVASDLDIAPYDLILPRSCFRGEALAVGDYDLTIGFGVFELAGLQEYSLGTAVLVNYPITVETEWLPKLRVQAEKLTQLHHDPRHLARQYLYYHQSGQYLPSLTIAESNWFDQFLQTDLDHHFQLLEHPYIATRLMEFSQSYWSAIATGRTIKAQTAIAQPDLYLQPDQVSVSGLPDGAEIIVLKLPFMTANDAWVMRNCHLPAHIIGNCIYLHPDTAATLQISFGGERLAFLSAIEHPTFAAEVADLQYPHNRYPTVDQSKTVDSFEQFVSAYQPMQIETMRRQVQHAIALLTETQRLTPEQRFSYLQDVMSYFQQLDQSSEQLDPVIVALLTQVRSLCSEFDSLDAAVIISQPALLQSFFNQLRQILKVVIGYLASVLRPVEKGQIVLNQDEIEICCAVSSYKPVAWLEDLPTDVYLNRPMLNGNLGAVDALIQQTNQIWATAPPLLMRPLVQFSQLFPFEPSKDAALSKYFSNYEKIAIALYHLRSASLTTPAIEAYQAELSNAVETLPELWTDSSLSRLAAQSWQWFHTRKRSDLTLRVDAEELELAKLIFLIFPQHILNQLKALQFTRLKVTGLQYFTNKHLGRNWGSQTVPITISQNNIVNSPDYGKTVVLVENELLGRLTAQSPRFPLGTTAIATIHPLPNSIVTATTIDGIPLRIRTHTPRLSDDQASIPLEIVSQPSEHNASKLLWYARVDGETIGLLCHRSVSVLKTLRRLHTGIVFEVNLHPLLPETAWVELDPSSVRYPQIWQHPSRLN